MNMKKLEEQFNKEYEFLYNAPGYVAGYNEAVAYFDQLLKANPEPIREFAQYRGDVVSSDREAAAFIFAYTKLGYDKEPIVKRTYQDRKAQLREEAIAW